MTWRITSRFGDQEWFRKSPHSGYDFAMNEGQKLYSIRDGVIKIRDFGNTNAGKTVYVEWEDGKTAIYGHLSKFAENLKDGDIVQKGQLLGYAGSTGHSTGNHLHFGVKENGVFIDPSPYIQDIQNMDKLVAVEKTEPVIDTSFSILDMLKTDEGTITNFIKMLTSGIINFMS
jgi:murein DD-endopeptidase MepM/ murein hydrolase activator NlpD